MKWSVVDLSLLENESIRLDPEFYKPEFLQNQLKIRRNKWDFLGNLSDSIKSFGAYALCNEVKYQLTGIPFLRCKDIQEGMVELSDVLYIDKKANSLLEKSEVKPKTVLFTMSGSVGNSAIATGDLNYPINSNQDIAKISTNANLNPFYLTVFLNSYHGRVQIQRLPVGSIQQHIFLWQLNKLEIPLFSTGFQDYMESIFKNALLLKTKSQTFYAQAQTLLLQELGLTDWKPKHQLTYTKTFSDTQTAGRFDAEYFQPKYEDIIAKIKAYRGGWDALGDLVTLKKCVEPGSEAYEESGVPFVRVSNLSKFGISDNNQQFLSEKTYKELLTHQPKQGEILLSKDATPGIAYYLGNVIEKMIPSGGILRLKIKKENLFPEYLTLVLNSEIVQKQIEKAAGGSIINHWRPDQVETTLIPILKFELQQEISKLAQESFDCRAKSKSLLTLAKTGVEKAIETSEDEAMAWMEGELVALDIEPKGVDYE